MRLSPWKKLLLIMLIMATLFSLDHVQAATDTLEDLHIEVYIHEDGSATITEQRKATLSEGTENYIIIGNLGNSTIRDFTVTEQGRTYDYVEDWDIDASRESKMFKHGIIDADTHYELVWGIGEYGTHEYTISYTITDFIKQLEDAQVLFWRFVNDELNIPPKNVTLEIEADIALSSTDERIWAFGFEGDIQFEKDKIIASNKAPLTEDDYVTALVKFKDGQFQTNDILEQTFEEIQEQAFEGSDYGTADSSDFPLAGFIVLGVLFIPFGIIIAAILIPSIKRNMKQAHFRKQFNEKYYRDIPYEGPFVDIYALLKSMNLANSQHILSAFLLKWMAEERIDMQEETKEKSFFSSKGYLIYLLEENITDMTNDVEKQLFEFLLDMAEGKGKITESTFIQWGGKNSSKMTNWELELYKQSRILLERNHYLIEDKKSAFRTHPYDATAEGKKFEGMIYMFMNYLQDFSLLNEHEPVNVKLWDELMVWAAVLGITEEVYDQFKALYPKYETESIYTSAAILSVNSYTTNVSASGGMGGASSSGGGGGSFGGGSGGGTR